MSSLEKRVDTFAYLTLSDFGCLLFQKIMCYPLLQGSSTSALKEHDKESSTYLSTFHAPSTLTPSSVLDMCNAFQGTNHVKARESNTEHKTLLTKEVVRVANST